MKVLIAFLALMLTSITHVGAEPANSNHRIEKIQILNDQGQAIVGASVLIGPRVGRPFPGNELNTDLNGEIVVPAEWSDRLPITIRANGYLSTSYMNTEPRSQVLQVHRSDVKNPIQIQGTTTSFPNLKKDGKVDFALVFPALKRRQLVQFDINAMISPEFDEIVVMSQRVAIPSNLTLPQQTENYILPITLDKPVYRAFVNQPGSYRLTATHGQFPLKQVINDLRAGKSFFDVIKYFRFIGGGQKDLVVSDPLTGQDIPVNQISYNKSIKVKAPNVPANQVMLAFSLVDQSGLMFPVDIKKVESEMEQMLFVPTDSETHYVVSVLTPQQEKKPNRQQIFATREEDLNDAIRLLMGSFDLEKKLDAGLDQNGVHATDSQLSGAVSVALLSANELTPNFLDLIAAPVAIDQTTLELTPPPMVNGIAPVATYLILSEVEKQKMGDREIERAFRMWEGFHDGWVTAFSAPESAVEIQPGKKYRWEVLFLGQSTNTKDEGEYFLDAVTHVTRNSLDF